MDENENEINQKSFHYLKEEKSIKEKDLSESITNKINENNENENFVNIIPPLNNHRYNNSKNRKFEVKSILPKTKLNTSTKIYNKNELESQIIIDIQKNKRINTQIYEQDFIKRKTIIRGEETKNVQITHIICSSKPSKFHITEKLSMKNIKTNPIQISKTYRETTQERNLKSSYSSSCQDNIKHNILNLKGKTTIYQHARGIGMTNDKKGNINPLFYNCEIKKLEPIKKDRNKEKVEYIENFRSKNVLNNKSNKSANSYKNDNNMDNQYQIIILLIIFYNNKIILRYFRIYILIRIIIFLNKNIYEFYYIILFKKD